MKRIGITGPTGAGKTTALQALVELDAHIIDADAVYHALLESSATLRAELAERFGITDKTYLFALRQNLVRDTLLRAANNIRFGDRRSVLGAIAARPELFGAETYAPRWHPLLKRPLLDRILKGRECRTLLYLRIALRRSSLRLRGRFNA